MGPFLGVGLAIGSNESLSSIPAGAIETEDDIVIETEDDKFIVKEDA